MAIVWKKNYILREIRIKRSDVKDKVEINVTLMTVWHHRLNGREFK